MTMKIWKKNAVLAIVILFVCVAVYLNWSYGRGETLNGDNEVNAEAGDGTLLGDTEQVNGTDRSESADGIDDSDTVETLEGDSEIADAAIESDYFATARLTRQQARDSSLSILRDSSASETLSQEKRDEAAESLSVIADYAMAEAQIENLVKAKGYLDCVAFINDDGIEVVVSASSDGLQAEDVSKIKDIVVGETDISVENMHIIEVAE